jgi:hypothetical protein
VLPRTEEFGCKGFNYTVTLGSDRLIVKDTKWRRPSSQELPVQSINAVIVRRKSIIPFAAFAALALIAAVLTKYNSLWFLVNLSAGEEGALSTAAVTVAFLCVIPAVSRALFVDVIISWAGRPKPFLVRFVPARQGRDLVRRFHGVSTGA